MIFISVVCSHTKTVVGHTTLVFSQIPGHKLRKRKFLEIVGNGTQPLPPPHLSSRECLGLQAMAIVQGILAGRKNLTREKRRDLGEKEERSETREG